MVRTDEADVTHRIEVESDTRDGFLLVCPSCGRRVVVHRQGGMTVIDRGDFSASHFGGNTGVDTNLTPRADR